LFSIKRKRKEEDFMKKYIIILGLFISAAIGLNSCTVYPSAGVAVGGPGYYYTPGYYGGVYYGGGYSRPWGYGHGYYRGGGYGHGGGWAHGGFHHR